MKDTSQAQAAFDKLKAACHTQPRTARDWKAFFEALASAFATILPLISPFFVSNDTEDAES